MGRSTPKSSKFVLINRLIQLIKLFPYLASWYLDNFKNYLKFYLNFSCIKPSVINKVYTFGHVISIFFLLRYFFFFFCTYKCLKIKKGKCLLMLRHTHPYPSPVEMVTFVVEHLEEEFYDWCQYGKLNKTKTKSY